MKMGTPYTCNSCGFRMCLDWLNIIVAFENFVYFCNEWKMHVHFGLLPLQPADYEPPFFKGCTEEEARNPWTKNPLRMEVGNVNSKHLVLALKVRE